MASGISFFFWDSIRRSNGIPGRAGHSPQLWLLECPCFSWSNVEAPGCWTIDKNLSIFRAGTATLHSISTPAKGGVPPFLMVGYCRGRLPSILMAIFGVFVPQAMAEEAPEDAVGGPEALDTPCEFSISH